VGEIVVAGCVSHSPGITGFPDQAPPRAAAAVLDGFRQLGAAVAAAAPDAVVMVSSEHFTNFFVANLPTFAVGTATGYELPATDAFARFLHLDRRRHPGHAELGGRVHGGLLARAFDPALVAGGYGFDEAFAVPLVLLGLAGATAVPVVPVVVNAVHPPCPTLPRCYALGEALGEVLAEQQVAARVAVVATGGLSHWVGLPGAGTVDTGFDAEILGALHAGDGHRLCALPDEVLDRAGNGAHEIRAWLVVAGAVGSVPFDVLAYEPVPAWLTGTAVVQARLAQRQGGAV
jgi:aromatic ring-opening dioxygenase catalytic subunit (LigB family)